MSLKVYWNAVGRGITMRASTIMMVALLAAGCESLPGSGPVMRDVSSETSEQTYGFTLVDLTAATVAQYATQPKVDRPNSARVLAPARVSLSPGDVIRVAVAETREGNVFAPLSVGGTVFSAVRVDDTGHITLPYAGQVMVKGLDTADVADLLREKVKAAAFEPEVYVELVANKSNNVLVSGEVRQPGRVSLLDGPNSLIDVINRAGGPLRPPHHTDVVIRRGRSVARVSLADVLAGRNGPISKGDEIVVEANVKTFNALGAVRRTGLSEFQKPEPTLLEALSQVGGLADNAADRRGVFVFRLDNAAGQRGGASRGLPGPIVFRLDMSRPDAIFAAQQFAIRPDDTIYVTTAPSYEWAKLIAPIAQGMAVARGAVSIESAVTN
ncbi:polysaccharide biosynthesis/export family protein [Microvirga sp. TS319]|uniref:polysaccharide biosynthesis/export family protein n=1 Tax=Microvirga sp. TS319 TaxID=3241165 RepID=UPI00351A882C